MYNDTRGLVNKAVMSKREKKKKEQRPNPRRFANRIYKQNIYALCKKVKQGDKIAEQELASELENNRLATWAVKHWNKVQKSKGRKNAGKNPVPTLAKARKPTYGNAFKPYQGGAFGLGKKS